MSQYDLVQKSSLLKRFLSVFLILAVVNILLQYLYTDFWEQPVKLVMRLGVAGYEILLMFIMASVLALPAWILHRANLQRSSKVVFLLLTLPIVAVLLMGWTFYSHFDRFIGSFAVQMVLQDGGQLLQFVGKMPSSVDGRIMSVGVIATTLCALIVFVNFKPLPLIRTIFSIAGVAAMTFSVVASLLWNMPQKAPDLTVETSTNTFQRLKDSKFQLLVARAGPFTEVASSLTRTFFSQAETFSIDTNRLEKITGKEDTRAPDQINRYNVVYMLIESLHPKVLQAFGSFENVMPTLNELSENAYVFNNAWAQASHSNYADIAAVSGQYPLRSMNIHFYPHTPEYPKSLPYDMLRPHGYKTGLFSSQNERWGLMENYLMSDSVDAFSHVGSGNPDKTTVYQGIKLTELDDGKKQFNYGEYMYQGSGNTIERLDGETTNHALAWVESLEKKDPIFLYFNYQASHVPFNALPENFERRFLKDTGEHVDKVLEGDFVGQPLYTVIDAYKDSLYYVDQNIKRVVDYMKATGRHEKTIYVVSADTSIRLTGELMGNGGDLWPDVLKIPVIIAAPSVNGRTVVDAPLEQIDIMPTVLGLIGVGPHPASQGIDVFNTENDPERVVYAVAQTPVAHQYSAIYKNWQLRHNFLSGEQTLHYASDEVEGKNPKQLTPNEIQWLAEQLRDWRLAQIGYYTIPQAHTFYYPPKYGSELWRSGGATLIGETTLE